MNGPADKFTIANTNFCPAVCIKLRAKKKCCKKYKRTKPCKRCPKFR